MRGELDFPAFYVEYRWTGVAYSPFHGGNDGSNPSGDAKPLNSDVDRRNRAFSAREEEARILAASTPASTPEAELRRVLSARIRSRTERSEKGCLVWLGAKSARGYGRIKYGKKLYSPHRVVLEHALKRVLEPWEDACHRCDNPSCVNRRHLFAGSRQDNMKDAARKRRLGKAPISEAGRERIRESNRSRSSAYWNAKHPG